VPHKTALLQLFPVKDLGGVHDGDATVEGASLDRIQAAGDTLLFEMFPDGADNLLADFERTCALTPSAADTYQARRDRVIAKLRARGGLSIAYFTQAASALGYNPPEYLELEGGGFLLTDPGGARILLEPLQNFVIEELPPNSTDPGVPEGASGTPATIFIWRIHILGQPVYQFRAGESCAGERLLDWASQTGVEGIFQDLKPAHTMLIFAYA
jgi:uncharacterized protein YmfQ (DUF2313 family)